MDLALAIDHLYPAASYLGSVADNTKARLEAITWTDQRGEKPTWEQLEAAWAEINNVSLADVRTAALESLRLRKWQAKEAGITVNGIAIDTDDKGQATISGAVTNVLLDPDFAANWKTSTTNKDGTAVWVSIGKDTILALAKALTEYTEACFGAEASKQAEIAALETVEQIQAWLTTELDKGWPSQIISTDSTGA